MSIDPLKLNLSLEEAGELLIQQTKGKIFEDGPYQYRIVVKPTDVINGLILTVTNEPDHIGPDLITYALTRLEVILRNLKEKDQLEFYILKIWMDSYGHGVDFNQHLAKDDTEAEFTFRDKDTTAQYYKNFDFAEANRRREINRRKLNTLINHFNQNYSEVHLSFDDTKFKHNKLIGMIVKRNEGVGSKDLKGTCVAKPGFYNSIDDVSPFTSFSVDVEIKLSKKNDLFLKQYDTEMGTESIRNLNGSPEYDGARYFVHKYIEKLAEPIGNYFIHHSPVKLTEVEVTVKGYDEMMRAQTFKFN